MSIGEKIKELRLERNWSQGDLSKRSGIDRRVISRYEVGYNDPTMSVIKKISTAFNVSVDYLVYNEPLEYTINDKELLKIFKQVDNIPPKYRRLVKEVVSTIVFKASTEAK